MKRSCSATGIPFLQVLLVLAKRIPKFMKVYKVCWHFCLLVKDYEGFTKQYRDGGHWWTDRYQSETFISFFYKVWTSLKLTTTAMIHNPAMKVHLRLDFLSRSYFSDTIGRRNRIIASLTYYFKVLNIAHFCISIDHVICWRNVLWSAFTSRERNFVRYFFIQICRLLERISRSKRQQSDVLMCSYIHLSHMGEECFHFVFRFPAEPSGGD